MVGHTHEDIDQMFSCFSRHLSKNDIRTLPELSEEMKKAYTPNPSTIVLDCMFEVKAWMEGQIEDKVTGHVHAHQFKIELVEGKAVVYYKKWSTCKEWLPQLDKEKDFEGRLMLVDSIPTNNPGYVSINADSVKFDEVSTKWWETT